MEREHDNYWWLFWLGMALILVVWLSTTSCHTVHGIGTDLQDLSARYVDTNP